MAEPHRIIVVGGGAGGLELVTRLGRRYRKRDDVEISLVDLVHSHIWKPLLHEVASGTLNSNDDELSYLAQGHWSGFHFRLGALESLDRAARSITLAPSLGVDGDEYIPRRSFSYDTLVLALGSVTNDFGTKGVAEHCFYLDSREQADRFHQHLIRACYTANTQAEPLREGQLHIAIAGAGATGVELAAELHSAIHALVGYGLDQINPERDLRIHIIEGADRILPGLTERISASTTRELKALGIRVHTGEMVSAADEKGFRTKSGQFIPAEIKVWAAGIRAPGVLGRIEGLEVNRNNQVIVEQTLQSISDENIFALGDCAACPLPDEKGQVPPRAQAAHQQALLLLKTIKRRLAGKPLPVYQYKDFGSLINLSHHSTVGNLMGNLAGKMSASISVEGWFARMAYLSLYKSHQLATQGLLRTLSLTLANWFTRTGKPRLKLH